MTVAVVTPTYNEAKNIGGLISGVMKLGLDIDVIVVDDSSPDGTGREVESMAQKYPGHVKLITRAAKDGIGKAYVAGFQYALQAGYDQIVQMDADGSHDPCHIPGLLEGLQQGADVVIGSRYTSGGSNIGLDSAFRRALSRCANFYARKVGGVTPHDVTSGFRAWDASFLSKLPLENMQANGFCFIVLCLHEAQKRGALVVERPIIFKPRANGESKMSFAIMSEGLRVVWGMRFAQSPQSVALD